MNWLNRRSLLALGAVGLSLVVVSPTFADDPTTSHGRGHGTGNPNANANGNSPDTTPTANNASTKGNGAAANAKGASHRRGLMGTVMVDSGNSNLWTITSPAWGSVMVDVSSLTSAHFKAPHQIVSGKGDVKNGDRVAILLTKSQPTSGPLIPQTVHLIPGQVFTHVTGTVTKVDSGSITMQTSQGSKTFTVNGDTVVMSGHTKKLLTDIQNNNLVTVVARSDGLATAIAIH